MDLEARRTCRQSPPIHRSRRPLHHELVGGRFCRIKGLFRGWLTNDKAVCSQTTRDADIIHISEYQRPPCPWTERCNDVLARNGSLLRGRWGEGEDYPLFVVAPSILCSSLRFAQKSQQNGKLNTGATWWCLAPNRPVLLMLVVHGRRS